MSLHVALDREGGLAHVTLEWFLSGVNAHVHCESEVVREHLAAVMAVVTPDLAQSAVGKRHWKRESVGVR